MAALSVVVGVQGDGGKCGIKARFQFGAVHAVVEAGGVAQVFARGEGGFDAGTVAEVEVRRVAANSAALRGEESGECLQQGGFAAAVVGGEVNDLSGGDVQAVVAQEQAAAFEQGEVVGFEEDHELIYLFLKLYIPKHEIL